MAALLLTAAALVAAAVVWWFLRRRVTPEERERLRRLAVSASGRMADGEVIDFEGDVVYYSYSVAGVSYSAAQDISALRNRVDGDAATLLGPATVKYAAHNPADSILVSEDWSGLPGT